MHCSLIPLLNMIHYLMNLQAVETFEVHLYSETCGEKQLDMLNPCRNFRSNSPVCSPVGHSENLPSRSPPGKWLYQSAALTLSATKNNQTDKPVNIVLPLPVAEPQPRSVAGMKFNLEHNLIFNSLQGTNNTVPYPCIRPDKHRSPE